MAETREKYLYMAKLAEKSERFENMMEYMENVALEATVAEELTAEERNLLAVAYKNVIGTLRNSLSTISTIEQRQEDQGNINRLTAIQSFRERIETEFSSTCGRILDFIETTLIPKSGSNVSKVFYLKMKGDYYRYLAESKIGFDQRKDIAEKTLSSYEIAQEAARAEFPPTHPIRLGVALNFSVFYYEILYSPVKACSMAKQAYDEAAPELDTLQGDSFKESTVIMQRLRENLALWTSDMQDGETEEDR